MKIIVAPEGTHGDTRPMLSLAKALRSDGHEIIACTSEENKDIFVDNGFNFYPVGLNVKDVFKEEVQTIIGNPVKGLVNQMEILKEVIAKKFSGLLATAEREGADYMLGSGLLLAGPSVAEYLRIPYRHVFHMPQVLPSREYPPISFPWQRLPGWVNLSLWLGARRLLNFTRSTINKHRKRLGLPVISDVQAQLLKGCIVAANKELASVPADVKFDFVQTGYWFLEDNTDLPQDLCEFLEKGGPTVFLSFGSMTDPNPQKTAQTIKEVVEQTDYRFVISRGWANLGKDLIHERVKIIDYVSHDKLFPLMSAIIHHGGAGTVHTVAKAGVPQIVVPHAMDQFYWGERVRSLGLGPHPIKRLTLSAKRLTLAINETVNNEMMKKRALTIKDKVIGRDGLKEITELFRSWATQSVH